MIGSWQRKVTTTKGSDPTVVVTWSRGNMQIVEFQGCYLTTVNGDTVAHDSIAAALGEQTHKVLEELHSLEEEVRINDTNDELSAPIYGGE